MRTEDKIERVRKIIQDARLRRGLPATTEATPYPIRRQQLLASIRHQARAYDFHDTVALACANAGRHGIYGLDLPQLEDLHANLCELAESMHQAFDSRLAPPAR